MTMKIRSQAAQSTKAAAPRASAPRSRAAPPQKKTGWQPKAQAPQRAQAAPRVSPQQVKELNAAIGKGDATRTLALLKGGTAESNAALTAGYRQKFGRDLEYDLRGFTPTLKGLDGPALKQAFVALHGPRVEQNAARIAELTRGNPGGTAAARREIYTLLSTAGGEERTMLDAAFKRQTGGDLAEALKPVADASAAGQRPITSDPKKTVAIVVSSGNWAGVLAGDTEKHVGGYHWREIEAYAKEALAQGYQLEIFTPDGLPPSPDALSLLQGKLGPKVGFGLAAGTGPDSPQGKAIMEGFAQPRSLKDFDPSKFATLHVAGGHGSHQDLVGNPAVEAAATKMHASGKIITAVCHATPALGKLLEGGPATGFSPRLDQLNLKGGRVLPEFDPPYDAHQGLRDLGAKFTAIDSAQAFLNINHTETTQKDGVPIVTGTGPEATDDVARIALKWLAQHP